MMLDCEHVFLGILFRQRIFDLLLPVVCGLHKLGPNLKQDLSLRDFWKTMRQVSWLKIFFSHHQNRTVQSNFLDVSWCHTCVQSRSVLSIQERWGALVPLFLSFMSSAFCSHWKGKSQIGYCLTSLDPSFLFVLFLPGDSLHFKRKQVSFSFKNVSFPQFFLASFFFFFQFQCELCVCVCVLKRACAYTQRIIHSIIILEAGNLSNDNSQIFYLFWKYPLQTIV